MRSSFETPQTSQALEQNGIFHELDFHCVDVGFRAQRCATWITGLGRRLPDDFVIRMPVSRH